MIAGGWRVGTWWADIEREAQWRSRCHSCLVLLLLLLSLFDVTDQRHHLTRTTSAFRFQLQSRNLHERKLIRQRQQQNSGQPTPVILNGTLFTNKKLTDMRYWHCEWSLISIKLFLSSCTKSEKNAYGLSSAVVLMRLFLFHISQYFGLHFGVFVQMLVRFLRTHGLHITASK